jgi:hypothetical protein
MQNLHDHAPQTPAPLSLLALARVLQPDALPPLVREYIERGEAVIGADELRALPKDKRTAVIASVEAAIAAYDERARRHRAGANPDARTATVLRAFLTSVSASEAPRSEIPR